VNLEAILMQRAEQQMHTDAWRAADRGENRIVAPPTCQVPGCWNPIGSGRTMCDECRGKGLAATPCKGCGGRIRRIDQRITEKSRRGYCQACRSDMNAPHGNRDMSAAHAALARKRRNS
jgi:hypothetical protein